MIKNQNKIDNLLFNITKHSRIPQNIRVISNTDEIKELCKLKNIDNIDKLPKILINDPLANFYGLRVGQLFEFKKYNPICFTIEHNFKNLEKYLDDLMSKNNYSRIFREITAFDGWYIRNDVLNKLEKDTSID